MIRVILYFFAMFLLFLLDNGCQHKANSIDESSNTQLAGSSPLTIEKSTAEGIPDPFSISASDVGETALKIVAELERKPRPLTYSEFVVLTRAGTPIETRFIGMDGKELAPGQVMKLASGLKIDPTLVTPEERGWRVEHWLSYSNLANPPIPPLTQELKDKFRSLNGSRAWGQDNDGNWIVDFDDGSVAVYSPKLKYLRGGKHHYNCLPYSIERQGVSVVEISINVDYSAEVRYSDGEMVKYSPKGVIQNEKN